MRGEALPFSGITFLIPFKGLRGAKTRWDIESAQREPMLLEILDHNLRTVAQVVGARSTVLVSPDSECFARFPTLRHFHSSAGDLNGDLRQARESLADDGTLGVLLPDLPGLTTDDVAAMLEASTRAQVVLCPDHQQVGTNGLVLSPSHCLDFLFEGASFKRYSQRALELGRSVVVLERPGLGEDADESADLERMMRL